MEFYTHATLNRGNVLIRGYKDNKFFQEKIKYEPYLFVPDQNGEYKGYIDNNKLRRKNFASVYEAREYLNKFQDVSNIDIYGSTLFLYQYLNQRFPDRFEYDDSLIKIVSWDIETDSKDGFGSIQDADKEIISISVHYNNKFYVIGTKDYKVNDDNVIYIKCKDEKHLLLKFIDIWKSIDPDIMTGWNITLFDIPYTVKRINQVLGENFVKKLSPWNIIDARTIKFGNKEHTTFDFVGIVSLDYLELYKKFALTKRESYSLDYISFVELEKRKVDYKSAGYKSLHDLYENNFQLFIDYNIQDTRLILELENKLNFIKQVIALAYDSKVNMSDTFGTVKLWEVMVTNTLENEFKTIPKIKINNENNNVHSIMGGFVKEPNPGFYNWIVTFDKTSLYPHLDMGYNISPETFVGKIDNFMSIEEQVNGNFSNQFVEKLKKNNVCVAGNGCLYTRDFKGIIPLLMERIFNDRQKYKKQMNDAKKQKEIEKDTNRIEILKKLISKFDNIQNAKKVQINGGYGALANIYYRFFNADNAEAITSSGQRAIQFTAKWINRYLNKILKTKDVDYIIAIDTDSLMITFDYIVQKYCVGLSKQQIVDFIDRFSKDKILPELEKCYQELARLTNAYSQSMKIKREKIADRGVWTGKKRYVMNVYDEEGVRFKEPKIKITGIEAVRSSTPHIVRDKIKETIKIIMENDYEKFRELINKFQSEFNKKNFEEISFPRGVNGMEIYRNKSTIFKKGTPIHVKGALIYNYYIEKYGLQHKYKLIEDGDKIKYAYLKMPNPLKSTVIACLDELPSEFNLDQYIDKQQQFIKSYENPMYEISKYIGWDVIETSKLQF